MADDNTSTALATVRHVNPRCGQPGYEPPTARIAKARRMLESGASEDIVIVYLTTVHAGVAPSSANGMGTPPKVWKVTEREAKRYIELAKTQTATEDAEDVAIKRGMNRAKANRVFAAACDRGNLAAAIRALEILCRIDKSYEMTTVAPTIGNLSDDEAHARIDHAAATLALARARGAAKPIRKIIEVHDKEAAEEAAADEADGDDTDGTPAN